MTRLRVAGQVALVAGGLLMSAQSLAVELMQWDRKPLDIDLPVGTERLVTLDRNVSVGLPESIVSRDVLRVQSAGGVLYLKAHEAFDTQRVQLKDMETGEILIVDLSAREGASSEEIQVVEEDPTPNDPSETAESEEDSGSGDEGAETSAAAGAPMPVTMTRYAAQSLYSPMRAVESVQGIRRTAMRLPHSLPNLMPALPLEASPVAAWTKGGWTVTAVELANQDPSRAFELDPRWLQGDYYSAAFMHPSVGPRGRVDDTTTVFIVTRGNRLAEAMRLTQEGG